MTIPVYELSGNGFEIYRMDGSTDLWELNTKGAHRRNDHYLLVFQQTGASELQIDARSIRLMAYSMLCIHPGQVHHAMAVSEQVSAWLLLVPVALIPHEQKAIFEQRYFHYQPVLPGEPVATMLDQAITLLYSMQQAAVSLQVRRSLLDAVTGLFAGAYAGMQPDSLSRRHTITRSFRTLLLQHFRTHKRSADYAALLAVTPSYLNEVVKAMTGSPVTYWIQEVIIAEAKRLLYNTDMTIKEIAFELGFDDQAHFARYFNRAAGMPPITFRAQYRKTS